MFRPLAANSPAGLTGRPALALDYFRTNSASYNAQMPFPASSVWTPNNTWEVNNGVCRATVQASAPQNNNFLYTSRRFSTTSPIVVSCRFSSFTNTADFGCGLMVGNDQFNNYRFVLRDGGTTLWLRKREADTPTIDKTWAVAAFKTSDVFSFVYKPIDDEAMGLQHVDLIIMKNNQVIETYQDAVTPPVGWNRVGLATNADINGMGFTAFSVELL